eukprot:1110108-Prorocentrum_minimum.AAC.1
MKPSPQFDKNAKIKINLKHANSMTRVAGKTPEALGSPESWGERLRASIDICIFISHICAPVFIVSLSSRVVVKHAYHV